MMAERIAIPDHIVLMSMVTLNTLLALMEQLTQVYLQSRAVGTFGNLERNAVDGPGYWRTDASMLKKFHINETMYAEFRIEVVNLFNHVNLGNPDSNLGSF